MRPEWHALPDNYRPPNAPPLPSIPFDRMWQDDPFWFDLLLSKRKFIGRVDFGTPVNPDDLNSAPLLKWWFGEILEQ